MGETLESARDTLEGLPVLGLVFRAVRRGNRHGDKDMAASIAYFSFFSLFPLLLGVIAGASTFVEHSVVQERLAEILANALPGSYEFVSGNVEAVFRLRGAAGAASLVGLLWSASKMAGALSRGINGALGLERSHPSILAPARRFLLTFLGAVLVVVALSLSTTVSLLARFDVGILGNVWERAATFADGHLTSLALIFVALVWLYRTVPFAPQGWRPVAAGAAVGAVLIEIGKTLFVFYISGIADFEAVYGSLSSVIVLMLWLYIAARIILLGAEVIALQAEDEVVVDP